MQRKLKRQIHVELKPEVLSELVLRHAVLTKHDGDTGHVQEVDSYLGKPVTPLEKELAK